MGLSNKGKVSDAEAAARGESFAKALRARLKGKTDFDGSGGEQGQGTIVVHHATADETTDAEAARKKAERRLFRLELRHIPRILLGKACTHPWRTAVNLFLAVSFFAVNGLPMQCVSRVVQPSILVIYMIELAVSISAFSRTSGDGLNLKLKAEGCNVLVEFTGRGTKPGWWSKCDDVTFYVSLRLPDDRTIVIDDFTANHVSRGCTSIAKRLLPLMIAPGEGDVKVGFHCKTKKLVEYYTKVFKEAFGRKPELEDDSSGYYLLEIPGRLF